jgi:hypothetical protein
MTIYTYDTEFVELGRERKILPLSIGIVCEDGREFYAQFIGEGIGAALRHDWVRQHVLPYFKHIEWRPDLEKQSSVELWTCGYLKDPDQKLGYGKALCDEPDCPWMSDETLAAALMQFMDPAEFGDPELWAYYAGYDHVVFCQTFGAMIDLPKGFPMYTRDLKQWSVDIERRENARPGLPPFKIEHPPQPEGEHDALVDARWNMTLYRELLQAERTLGLI